jgi:poly(A) polymerase
VSLDSVKKTSGSDALLQPCKDFKQSSGGKSIYPPFIFNLFRTVCDKNHEIYMIGPRARDLASGGDLTKNNSFDFTTSLPGDKILSLFHEEYGIEPVEVKKDKVKVFTFHIPYQLEENKSFEYHINIGPYRNYLPPIRSLRNHGLKGIILDLATREVTIQAFGYDIKGDCLDPFCGLSDFQKKRINPVFPVDVIFKESGGWHLKIARYISRYGFATHPDVFEAAEKDAHSILDVPRDFWRTEMEKILTGPFVMEALQHLYDTRILFYILPEVAAMAGFNDTCEVHHKDIWDHTKQVVHNAESEPVVRWSALCHDIGKVWTRRVFKNGKVHFFKHEDLSAILFEGIAGRFKMPEDFANKVHYIIQNHSRTNLYREDWTDSAVRRLISQVGEHLDNLIMFSKADLTSSRTERIELIKSLLTDLQIRILEVKEKDGFIPPLKKGFGNFLMEYFHLEPGPEIGRLKAILEKAITENKISRDLSNKEYAMFLERELSAESADDGK